ncbi:hypothetical protein [Allochromatium palmeri]|uniref:DUF4239 domain-containing protein n=1 Tax=Allochromatium palmeri TaxID=231048 RepID=A0A6N8EJU6_9GAMM|nr:hypothetical protein [Allochromatium palmeri]MTW23229.1 hypothetical protein [Allochromatium palmeri]
MSSLLEDPIAIVRYPIFFLPVSFVVLSLATWIGASRLQGLRAQIAEIREDYRVVEGATLTLLALIIGFTFSMALERYDQRKNLEEEEANAIGTEYLRADLLPEADGARARELIVQYIDQRIRFYRTRDEQSLLETNSETARLQSALWTVVVGPAEAQPTPVMALAVAGMNDMLNTQGYTQAAWVNRIPLAAWALLTSIAICSALLVGLGARNTPSPSHTHFILPLVISIAFFLVADIDSPRRGMIRIPPQNLMLLATSLKSP